MRGATILKATDDKTRKLSEHCIMAYSGEAGDTGMPCLATYEPTRSTANALSPVQFAEYIQANISLYSVRNSHALSPSAIAAFTRNELAKSLRSRKPYNVNLLLGGIELPTSTPTTGTLAPESVSADSAAASKPIPRLFWLDYLSALAPLPYAAHGYAQYYCLAILDKHHHPDIELDQGLKLLKMCTDELKRRMPVDFKGVTVKVITAEGVQVIPFEEDFTVKSA